MKPFDREYVLNKIQEYNNKIKNNKIGDFEIKSIDGLKGRIQGYLYSKEDNLDIRILELHAPEHVWMRLTPLEIQASYFAIKMARGKVGVVGLGLGYAVEEMAKKPEVEEITVYEISQEVIDLYYSNFPKNPKINIVCCNAYEAERKEFDFFYADIYEYKITSQIVEDYKKFNELHNIEEYSFFGMEHFLLSCSYTEIVWVYIPENWMESSRRAFEAIQESNLLPYYEKLDDNLVSQVLEEFKEVLNDI
ncbi:hypothetical protein [Clostridium sp. 1001271B_151109_B4]|uniref:hypothetical protein n=1 Tax=Clostridium sp. 1001271B_151109_B4 TaxID=2787148 RepID=UPI0018AC4A3A|nr:hypothetical protein [Clostridium sp. 1001271B_151109_B4]